MNQIKQLWEEKHKWFQATTKKSDQCMAQTR